MKPNNIVSKHDGLSAQALLNVMDQFSKAIVIVDFSGTIRYMNSLALQLYNLNNVEQANEQSESFAKEIEFSTLDGKKIPHDDWPIQRLKRGKEVNEDMRVKIKRTNLNFIAHCTSQIINQPPSEDVLAVLTFRDITKEVILARRAAENEKRLAMAVESSGLGVWEWDMQTNKLTWSNRLKEMYGVPKNKTITFEKYRTLLHPDDIDKLDSAIQKVQKKGGTFEVDHRIVLEDGSIRWTHGTGMCVFEEGRPTKMLGMSRDIHEQKIYENKLHESQKRFRALADSTPVLIWEVDASAQCTYVNKTWLSFTGNQKSQELGDGWRKSVHKDDRERCNDVFLKNFTQKKSHTVEYLLEHHTGSYRRVLEKAVPRYAENGDFLGYIGSCIDIHDLEQTKKERNQFEHIAADLSVQREELVKLNDAKDEFISLASHQLRTPATSVKQYVGMVLEGYAGDLKKAQEDMLEQAYENNERQLRIISDLLKVAQVDSGKIILNKEKVDVRQLMRDILDSFEKVFKDRNQCVTLNCEPPKIHAQIDKNRTRMALENLVDNASKYTPEGQDISVHITTDSRAHILVKVVDQGVGMRKKDLGRLFQKFSRLDNELSIEVGGSGLGLYWAQKIIQLHSGSIAVESRLNKGSTFTVQLPIAK